VPTSSSEPEHALTVDVLDIADGVRLEIAAGGSAAVPMVLDGGAWRRATAGDGAAEALLTLLAAGSTAHDRFTIRSWTARTATGERTVGVDQTNESVIVGDIAVVKWATHLQAGPHPAPHRIAVLREAGFDGMPAPWGLITWQSPDGAETLAVSVDEYLPGAVDGWTWAVDLITDAALTGRHDALTTAAGRVGTLIADMHAALAPTRGVPSERDVARWRRDAVDTLETVCGLEDSASVLLARERRAEITTILEELGTVGHTAVIDGHGDLHVGQILRSGERFVVTDFDGNPVLPADQRALPIPTVLDVAGMTQSLTHAGIVAGRYTELDPAALAAAGASARSAFLTAYTEHPEAADLYAPELLRPLRLQQVLREIVYAARHLPRWMYVPDAALPALLDDGTIT
jgi:maltokinase